MKERRQGGHFRVLGYIPNQIQISGLSKGACGGIRTGVGRGELDLANQVSLSSTIYPNRRFH
jgi:hypothetical protein